MAPGSHLAAFEGDAPVANSGEWLSRRAPLLRQAFLARIYGAPPRLTAEVVEHRAIDDDALDGSAQLELLTLRLGPNLGPLNVALPTPRTDRPAPLIILSDFCEPIATSISACAVLRGALRVAVPVLDAPSPNFPTETPSFAHRCTR